MGADQKGSQARGAGTMMEPEVDLELWEIGLLAALVLLAAMIASYAGGLSQ
jgi:hypothetical protein